LSDVAGLLRAEGAYAVGRAAPPWARLAALLALGGAAHGAVMGMYALRAEQALYSAVKVPLLLGAVTLVCLPSFFAVHVALGLSSGFRAACNGVLAAQATLAVTLASLSPLVLFAYASGATYRQAILANGAAFAVATLAGQATLRRHYRPLLAIDPRYRLPRVLWGALYVFVAIQGAWVLRPFVGAPGLRPSLLRAELWTNAYVVVARTVGEVLLGR
jgi:hypothetical protein